MDYQHKPQGGGPPKPEQRRAEAEVIIGQILHGTRERRVDPAVAENLRKHLAAHPGKPDRALLAHFRDQIPGFAGVFPEDLEDSPSG